MPEQLAETVDPANWSCPAPLRDQGVVVMGHGGGGALSAELMEQIFTPAYGNAVLAGLADSAVLELGGARLAFSTDSYVVRPLFFPGGCLGDLAVNGTVNDLAMSGAGPAYLSAAFVLEEGVGLAVVERIARAMGAAAEAAGVTIATGDTKVVESGHGDGVYVTTAGVGLVPDGVDIRPQRARPGDAVIVSGPIGLHGVAIMSVREGLEFGVEVASDTAPLAGLVAAMLAVTPDIHVLRDPTRAASPRPSTRSRGPPEPVCGCGSGPFRCRTRWRTPAVSWGSTRSTSPTRAGWSPSCPRRRRRMSSRRCAPTRRAPGPL